ncbi:hypothetical protein BHYA_0107g00150 [Botrytis hyacinthi]|uniref:Uncharacterized protein n=1 Tax=Botrytis hyacinthi TaxID=278943 RepID=A0A4Z1GP52_9HELO|nr:hypothetical protein BHYA_0107g00150 [Botrytis hyacinthi]
MALLTSPAPPNSLPDALTSTSILAMERQNTFACHTQYKLVLDTFNVWGHKWDTSKLDDGGDYLHGNGLLNQLGRCGTISKWNLENMTVDASNPYEWHTSSQTTIWQKGCVEHANVSTGAPSGSCSGTG